MIQQATSVAATILSQISFMPSSNPPDYWVEFFEPTNGIMVQAERVVKGFVRSKSKLGDHAFFEECLAEAWFVAVEMMWEQFAAIKAKYPEQKERDKFFRMSIIYRLKEYWSYRATTTISYLKRKGIVVEHLPLNNAEVYTNSNETGCKIALENAARDELEKRIVEFYTMGNNYDLISEKCGIHRKQVKAILARIKKRLIMDNHDRVNSHIQISLRKEDI